MAVEAAVSTAVVEAAAFMAAVAEVRIAAAECLAGARHAVVAVSAEAADRLAADAPQAQVSLSVAAANRAVSQWVVRAATQAGREAARLVQVELRQLMAAVLTASAETVPVTLVPRTMPAMVLPTGSGIHSVIAAAAVELRAGWDAARVPQTLAAFTRQV
jgi:hypothetical protein